jgi:uncharacterized membrane protein YsdA (DUF1294 family)
MIRNLLFFTASVYAALGFITLAVYAFDKFAAASSKRRIPEKVLHLLALLGGWPGALIGQKWLRHKTAKPAFLRVFWLTVLANVAALSAALALLLYFA